MHLKEKMHSLPEHNAAVAKRSPSVTPPMGRVSLSTTVRINNRRKQQWIVFSGGAVRQRRFRPCCETRGGKAIVRRSGKGDGDVLDLVGLNAGVVLKPLIESTEEDYDFVFNINTERRFLHASVCRPSYSGRWSHCPRFDRRYKAACLSLSAPTSWKQRSHRAVRSLALARLGSRTVTVNILSRIDRYRHAPRSVSRLRRRA